MSISEKDAVLRERRAFASGARWRFERSLDNGAVILPPINDDEYHRTAERTYPLPKVTQPRVVRLAGGFEYRVNGNTLEVRTDGEWKPSMLHHVADVLAFADLIANPTEEVEA